MGHSSRRGRVRDNVTGVHLVDSGQIRFSHQQIIEQNLNISGYEEAIF